MPQITMNELNTALSSKANSSQVLTDVPAGAVFTDTNTDTTYSAGLGLGLSGTTLNVEFDSTASEGAMKNVSGTISVYATGSWRQIYPAVYS